MKDNSRSCHFKGGQKVFLFDIQKADSCCRADLTDLTPTQDVNYHIALWEEESKLLDQGVKISSCEYCWRDEDQGKTSYRLNYIDQAKNHVIELKLSNSCNQMCSYCEPRFSSTWNQSITEHGTFDNISKTARDRLKPFIPIQQDNSEYINQINSYINQQEDNSVILKLLGGEPTMLINNIKQLESLNSEKIQFLSINTNLNPPNNKFLKSALDIYRDKLIIEISLDATPECNHIPRGLFNKDKFIENLSLVKNYNIERLKFLPVVSSLSIPDLPNFIQWLKEQGIPYNFQKLNTPECLDIRYLPNNYKEIMLEKLEPFKEDLPAWIFESLTPSAINKIRMFEKYNYLLQYFNRTGIDINSIDIYKEYWHNINIEFNKL